MIAGTMRFTTLAKGYSYQIRVRAVNAMGAGLPSAVYEIQTLATVPGRPAIHWITKTTNSLTVDITPPVDDGGLPSTGFAYTIDESTWHVADATTVPNQIVITGLKAARTYTLRVAAINSLGRGTRSYQTVITTLR